MALLTVAILLLTYASAVFFVAAIRRALIRVPVRSTCSAPVGEPPLDEAGASTLQRLCHELQGAGFHALGAAEERRANGSRGVVSLFVSAAGTSTATLLMSFAGQRLITGPFVNIVSELDDGTKFATTNARFMAPIPLPRGDRIARLPGEQSAAVLAKVHESRLSASRAKATPRAVGTEPAATYAKFVDDDRRRLCHAGIFFQASDSEYRLRWWAAIRGAVNAVPPTAQLAAARSFVNATRLLGATKQ